MIGVAAGPAEAVGMRDKIVQPRREPGDGLAVVIHDDGLERLTFRQVGRLPPAIASASRALSSSRSPVAKSHIIVSWLDPLTMRSPATATLYTSLVCPWRVCMACPVLASHTRTVLPNDPLTMRSPATATLLT